MTVMPISWTTKEWKVANLPPLWWRKTSKKSTDMIWSEVMCWIKVHCQKYTYMFLIRVKSPYLWFKVKLWFWFKSPSYHLYRKSIAMRLMLTILQLMNLLLWVCQWLQVGIFDLSCWTHDFEIVYHRFVNDQVLSLLVPSPLWKGLRWFAGG